MFALAAVPPSPSATTGRVHVAWRAVLRDQVRDIVVATSPDGGNTWGAAVRLAEDNWRITGCPHSGASLAVLGKRLFASWYTVREKKAAIYLAHSDDAGGSFSARQPLSGETVDPNHPYPTLALEEPGRVFVAWTETSKDGPRVLLSRGRAVSRSAAVRNPRGGDAQ